MELFITLKKVIKAFCMEKGLKCYAPKEYNDEVYVIDPNDKNRLFGIIASDKKVCLSYGASNENYALENKMDVEKVMDDIKDNYIFFMDSCKKANKEGDRI